MSNVLGLVLVIPISSCSGISIKRVGSLATRNFGNLSGSFTPPRHGGMPSAMIFILHGWGADCSDLADLVYPISLNCPSSAFFVPNAPELCRTNSVGRQWFDIEDRKYGPLKAAPTIEHALAKAAAELNLPASAMALIGFSQGGMMSLHCGLHMQDKPGAIVSFSGALLVHETLKKGMRLSTDASQLSASDLCYPPVQLVHGTEDPVVPFALMQEAQTILDKKNIEVETIVCSGVGHGISPVGLTAAINFLARHLPT